jgi:hypothetical protein
LFEFPEIVTGICNFGIACDAIPNPKLKQMKELIDATNGGDDFFFHRTNCGGIAERRILK